MTDVIAGMTVAQAKRIHRERNVLRLTDMDNNSINPSSRSMHHLRKLWQAKNPGSPGGLNMLSAVKRYAERHPASRIAWDEDDGGFVVVLATELMLRVHKEFREAGEVVFVDTSSHVDQINTNITPLLCTSPVGAMPLGVIFSTSEDEASYTKGMIMKMLTVMLVIGHISVMQPPFVFFVMPIILVLVP